MRRFVFLLMVCLLSFTNASADTPYPQIVTSIFPVQMCVKAVMGRDAPVSLIMGAGSSLPSLYVLKPSDKQMIDKADMVFMINPAFEGFLAQEVTHNPKKFMFLSDVVKEKLLPIRTEGAWADEGLVRPPALTQEEQFRVQAGEVLPLRPYDYDYHIWLSPDLLQRVISAIEARLVALDPAHAELYQQNAATVRAQLRSTDEIIRHLFAPLQDSSFFVTRDVLHYLEDAYHLKGIGVLAIHPDEPLTPVQLRLFRQKIREGSAHCLLSEAFYTNSTVANVTERLPIKVGVVDPFERWRDKERLDLANLLLNTARDVARCLE